MQANLPTYAQYSETQRWLMTGATLIGMIAMVLSSTSVTVAVPNVMGAFGVGQDKAQWLSTAYFAAMTGAMLLTSWLQNRFGQRTVFLLSLIHI